MSGPSISRRGEREAVGAAAEHYGFEHLLRHAAAADSPELWRRLLARLEADDFLARQAERPGGFELGAYQLEHFVLPATADLGDWERYFRYLLTAATLRDLARTLDDPEILRALARSGRLDLAEALVVELPEPAVRARGWAVLAAVHSPADPVFERLLRALRGELDAIPEPAALAGGVNLEPWADSLAIAGRLLAPWLRALWRGWIVRLSPSAELTDDARLAVVEGFFAAGELDVPEPWEILAEVQSSERRTRLLSERLATAGPGESRRWLERLRERLPKAMAEPGLSWSVALALLVREGAEGASAWPGLVAELDPPIWDRDLLAQGGQLWPHLSDDELQALSAQLGDPGLVAALRVLVLEGRQDRDAFREALAALAEVTEETEWLGLYLRTLGAAPPELTAEVESRARSVLAQLSRIQYRAPPDEICLALDLVARRLPHRLRRSAEAALAAPGSGPELLRTLAARCRESRLLDELFARAESYAAMAANNAAEGFELRGEVLTVLACRLVQVGEGAEVLGHACERLLPEEEDHLRVRAARILAPTRPRLASELCDGIRDRRLQLRTRLEVLPADADLGGLVAPGALYRVAAGHDAVEDELHALGGLLDEPRKAAKTAAEHFERIGSPGRRIEALADLARHALRYQELRFPPGRQDRPEAVLPLKEALGVVESDRWLVSLTPELVAIGGQLGPVEAVAEVQEACERVAGLETVSWERREEVIVEVLWRVGPLLLGGKPGSRPKCAANEVSRKQARALIAWLVRMPERAGDEPAGAHLRSSWHRILPCIVAFAESLQPRPVGWRRLVPGVARLWPSVPELLETSAEVGSQLAPQHREIFDLCRASARDRLEHLEHLLEVGNAIAPDIAHALSWLLVRQGPDRLPDLQALVVPGVRRDRMVLSLLRSAPLPGEVAGELIFLLSGAEAEAGARDWGRAWLGASQSDALPEADGARAVAALVSRDRIDPGDPATIPIRRRLWTEESDDGAAALGRAALGALDLTGGAGAVRAARLFLNAYLRPCLGQVASAEAHDRHAEMWLALERARSLESSPVPTPATSADRGGLDGRASDGNGGAGVGALERFQRWRRVWARRVSRLGEPAFHEAKRMALLVGITAIPILGPFQSVLFGTRLEPSPPPGGPFPWLAILVLLAATDGLLIGAYLARSTPDEWALRRLPLLLRGALATIPIFGLLSIPLWRWLVAERGGWLRRAGRLTPAFPTREVSRWRTLWQLGQSDFERRLGRWVGRQGGFVTLFLVNVAGVVWALIHLLEYRRAVLAGAAVAQVAYFAVVLLGLALDARGRGLAGWPAVRSVGLSVFWLPPIPLLPLVGLLGMVLLDPERRGQCLARQAFGERNDVQQLAVWSRLVARIRNEWGGVRWYVRLRGLPESVRLRPEPTRRERTFLGLLQAEGVLLFCEAGCAAELLGVSRPEAPGRASPWLLGLFGVCLLGGALGLAGWAVAYLREVARPQSGRRVFSPRLGWGHLAGSQLAVAFGLIFGTGVIQSGAGQAGGALIFAGLCGATLQVGATLVGLLFRSAPEGPLCTPGVMVMKVLGYSSAALLGLQLSLASGLEVGRLLRPFEVLLAVSPLLGALVGVHALRELADSAAWRASLSGRFPWRTRLRSLALAVTLVAPLGALAMPWWIRIERLGRWPGVYRPDLPAQSEPTRCSRSSRPSTPSSLPSR